MTHITHTVQKAFIAQKCLYPLIQLYSPLTLPNKILVYKQIIWPNVTYAAPIWCSVSDRQYNHLQVTQNIILRNITNLNIYTRITDLHTLTNMQTVKEFVFKMSQKFFATKTNVSNITENLTYTRYRPYRHLKYNLVQGVLFSLILRGIS